MPLPSLPAIAAVAALGASAAADDPRARAFQATTVAQAQVLLGVQSPELTKRVKLEVPDIVDGSRSAAAPLTVRVTSTLPGTDWIALFVDRKVNPLVIFKDYPPGADHVLVQRTDLAQTGTVRVLVRAAGKYYQVSRQVKVARKDCESP